MAKVELDAYHRLYEMAQPLEIVGRWQLSADAHTEILSEHFGDERDICVLYCGTATKRNPIDTEKAISAAGFGTRVTTVDLNSRPLRKLGREYMPTLADATRLPFAAGEFNVITSDFLFNMMPLSAVDSIVCEWSRVLSESGVISTTVFLAETDKENWYTTGLRNIAAKHFFSREALSVVFAAHGFSLRMEDRELSQRPWLYHSQEYTHITAIKADDEAQRRQAQKMLALGERMTRVINSESGMAKTDLGEVLTELIRGDFALEFDTNGEVVGWARKLDYANDWSEIGSVWVDVAHRGQGIALKLTKQLIEDGEQRRWWSATENPAMARVLEKCGFAPKTMTYLPLGVLIGVVRERGRVAGRLHQVMTRSKREIWIKD